PSGFARAVMATMLQDRGAPGSRLMIRVNRVGILACGIATLLGGAVRAQTPSPMGYWQFSAGEVLAPVESMPKWRITVGPVASYGPKYEGSQHYTIQPGADFEVRYRERLYLSTG